MIQKIIKIGNSAGIIIPKAFMAELNWRVGDKIVIEPKFENKVLLLRLKKYSKKIK